MALGSTIHPGQSASKTHPHASFFTLRSCFTAVIVLVQAKCNGGSSRGSLWGQSCVILLERWPYLSKPENTDEELNQMKQRHKEWKQKKKSNNDHLRKNNVPFATEPRTCWCQIMPEKTDVCGLAQVLVSWISSTEAASAKSHKSQINGK